MSGKVILGATIAAAAVVIAVVHYQQVSDKVEMKKGIERDKLRVASKKSANSAST